MTYTSYLLSCLFAIALFMSSAVIAVKTNFSIMNIVLAKMQNLNKRQSPINQHHKQPSFQSFPLQLPTFNTANGTMDMTDGNGCSRGIGTSSLDKSLVDGNAAVRV